MVRLKFILTLCSSLVAVAVSALQAQSLYVGEFNIRNDNTKDAAAGNGWAVRCPVVCDILKVESFDIFGQGFCLKMPFPVSGLTKLIILRL